jgi:hypothetical protein
MRIACRSQLHRSEGGFERRTSRPRLDRRAAAAIEQGVEAKPIEVERISESHRFLAKL